MLYPKEDKANKVLLYACRNCDHQEAAEMNCVYRNEIRRNEVERTKLSHDVTADPTLPRTRSTKCAVCGGREAVFFQANTGDKDEALALYFVCCDENCGHRWRE
ncbi:DNA-directed RNA polymerases II, IV and V subunit 9A, variant 2 [Balamuthia mandrillaris]